MFLESLLHASIWNTRQPSLLRLNARAGRSPGDERSVESAAPLRPSLRPQSGAPPLTAPSVANALFPRSWFPVTSPSTPQAHRHTPPYGPRSGFRRACSRRRRCAMDESLGESRAGAHPQHWGDFAVLLASSSGTQGKADDVSADPRLLPPSPPELGSAGQRQHQLRLPREAVLGEHVLHGRAAVETMVDAASEGTGHPALRITKPDRRWRE